MNAKSLVAALLVAVAAAGLAPGAAAQGETCTVAVTFWTYSVACTGLITTGAYLVSCPNHPAIDCFDSHIVTCTVGTTTPWCVLA